MRTATSLASLLCLKQSKDVLVQAQPEEGKVTEKTGFLLIMCQGTGSKLKPCRKATERLDSYFDRAQIEPGAHSFNSQGNQTDRLRSHWGDVALWPDWWHGPRWHLRATTGFQSWADFQMTPMSSSHTINSSGSCQVHIAHSRRMYLLNSYLYIYQNYLLNSYLVTYLLMIM